jgi:hypothetical protein
MVADVMPEQGNKETKQRVAALNAWEDEGGKPAAVPATDLDALGPYWKTADVP